jgi:hypothetical protein
LYTKELLQWFRDEDEHLIKYIGSRDGRNGKITDIKCVYTIRYGYRYLSRCSEWKRRDPELWSEKLKMKVIFCKTQKEEVYFRNDNDQWYWSPMILVTEKLVGYTLSDIEYFLWPYNKPYRLIIINP